MEIKKITVIGSGLMGRGVAQVSAQGGYQTDLYDVSEQALQNAMDVIKKNLSTGVSKGKMSQEDMDKTLANLNPVKDLKGVSASQMVIENVPEVMDIKWDTYKKINELCSEETIIASNTSSMSITELASITKRPDKFIGMHFFNPVHIMRLVEIIKGLETSDDTYQSTAEVAKNMGKSSVLVNDFPGFVTSRMNVVIGLEAFKMLEQGVASPKDIDTAIKLGLNHPMGPFEMIDLVGLDTRLRICDYLASVLGADYLPSATHRRYVAAGRFGRKAGKGVYEYDK